MVNSKSVLSLSGISKSFGSLEILKGVDLTLNEGQCVAVVGPSGAGKSTLLHIAGLMASPTSGDIVINQTHVASASEIDRDRLRLDKVGFLFQFHHLLPDFDVLENVMMPARLANDNLDEAEDTALSILKRVGLSHRLHHRPYQLSGGEQQRTALARAILRHPALILCDEPTGNLDPETAKGVLNLIWSEIREFNLAAIIVTHNEKVAAQADTVYKLVDGVLKKAAKGK